jgi:hypothetical protein
MAVDYQQSVKIAGKNVEGAKAFVNATIHTTFQKNNISSQNY